MPRFYVAAKNDGLFIIDQPPRPSNDDVTDIPGVNVIAKFTGNDHEAQRIAHFMVSAYNAALAVT